MNDCFNANIVIGDMVYEIIGALIMIMLGWGIGVFVWLWYLTHNLE